MVRGETPACRCLTASCSAGRSLIKPVSRRSNQEEAAHPLAAVLAELHPPHDLLVDQVGGHVVVGRVVPGVENLLPEEQPPGGVPLLGALLLGVLLALGDGVHDVVAAAAQRRHLSRENTVNGSDPEHGLR